MKHPSGCEMSSECTGCPFDITHDGVCENRHIARSLQRVRDEKEQPTFASPDGTVWQKFHYEGNPHGKL